jgi:hypothetical protein
MNIRRAARLATATLVAATLAWMTLPNLVAQDGGVIRGVVRSASGPEEGVWVIAETTSLPTKYRKIVVTGDGGRYVLPELPAATYSLWVRGYGLVDSKPVQAKVGQTVDLTATVAANPREAARIYPADYWYSLIQPPKADEFPGTGTDKGGNGIAVTFERQQEYVENMKLGCMLCHQMGSRITRELQDIQSFDSTVAAWDNRVQQGQRGVQMNGYMSRFGRERALKMFADWNDRISSGEVPPAPPRPKGVERNIVISMYEWSTDIDYVHDHTSTDKRNPRLNANGPIYGVNISNDKVAMLDPKTFQIANIDIPTREDRSTMPSMITRNVPAVPSRFYGKDVIWNDPSNPHNPMYDEKGRVWMTTAIRGRENPSYCKEGSDHPSAKYFPLPRSGGRNAGYYDPATKKFTLIDTCYGTHHLQFADDENRTLYFSGGGQVIGWLDTKKYDETGDEMKSQAWCPLVLDTNGDGKITKPWNEPIAGTQTQAEGGGGGRIVVSDPKLDTRIAIGSYGIIPDPTDKNVVWVASTAFPGRLGRLNIGSNPPETCIAEMYEVPSVLDPKIPKDQTGFGSRGIDITRDGVIWTALSGSSHFASFDRRKCPAVKGTAIAEGRHCVEGWKLYRTPSPIMKNTDPPAGGDSHYFNWVDQWNTLGLGPNTPIMTGSNSDSLIALRPDTGEWVYLRVPYPQGFFTRGMDGRIDDPNAGWKGRGVWASMNGAVTWHLETGKGVKPVIAKFQVRPDPLAY